MAKATLEFDLDDHSELSIDDFKLELLDHFVEYGYDIWVSDEQAHLIVSEMPFLDVYDAGEKGGFGGNYTMMAKKLRQPTAEEAALYYKDWFEYYRDRCNKIESQLEGILG